jgi:hypothetical protein
VKDNHDRSLAHCCPLLEQFQKLITLPCAALPKQHKTLVVLIDALDECSLADGAEVGAEVNFLQTLLASHHPGLKFFLTSRPNPQVQIKCSFRLHDIERDIVDADVKRYLRRELSEIFGRHGLGLPPASAIHSLVHKSGQLFIFAFTAVKYLSQQDLTSKDVYSRLHDLLIPLSDTPPHPRTGMIDQLYTQIFTAAWSGKLEREVEDMRAVLNTIICLRRPLSTTGISALLGETPGDMEIRLRPFCSVIEVPGPTNSPIVLFHASFPDYVTDPRRSHRFALDTRRHHLVLASLCLRHMNEKLQKNMCRRDRTTSISSFSDADIAAAIPETLQYACLYWASHLSLADDDLPDGAIIISHLKTFINSHLLHWLECLSILKKLDVAAECLQHAISSRQVNKYSGPICSKN